MKANLSQRGVVNLLIPLLLVAGIVVGVILITAGPLNLFPKAAVFRPLAPTTSFTLEPNNRNIGVGDTVAVTLQVRSDVAATNLFTAKIDFEKESLIVEKIDYSNTLVKNWVEQYYDNALGQISLVGGVPNPGYKSNVSEPASVMATVYFRALKAGSTKVSFSNDSQVFDNASNLNILTTKNDAKIAVSSRGVVEVVNILDYFISKHQDKGLTGTHPFSQTVEGQVSYYVKWDANTFEVHTWDDNYIYLHEDHSGAPVNFYGFKPGIWLKRYMQLGEKITQMDNKVNWFDPSCKPISSQPFPIEITLEKKIEGFDLGGDLGKQDVIVVKYDSSLSDPNGIFERFYYSKEWGWVLWEEYLKSNESQPRNKSIFNKITSNPIRPNKSAACVPIVVPLPTPAPIACTPCSADLDGNKKVTSLDYSIAVTCVNKGVNGKDAANRSCVVADIDKNGKVDDLDVKCVSSQFGKTCEAIKSPSVPVQATGDGNNNGKADLGDMSVLLTDFNKDKNFREQIDLNSDTKINTLDYSLLKNVLIEKKVIRNK